MNNNRIALVLCVAASLGLMVYKAVSKPAIAKSEARRAKAPAGDFRRIGFAGAGAAIAAPLAANLETSPPSMGNPFPALASMAATVQAAPGQATPGQEGFADLNPINRSGIRALINVKRIGQTETITGFATNMDPYKAYISLFHDAGSPGSGPCACIPSAPPPAAVQATCKTTESPAVNFSQMAIGYWLPLIGSSTRTLQVLKTGAVDAPVPLAYVPLENVGSISVREDTQLGQPLPAAHDPARFQLRACGKFRIDTD